MPHWSRSRRCSSSSSAARRSEAAAPGGAATQRGPNHRPYFPQAQRPEVPPCNPSLPATSAEGGRRAPSAATPRLRLRVRAPGRRRGVHRPRAAGGGGSGRLPAARRLLVREQAGRAECGLPDRAGADRRPAAARPVPQRRRAVQLPVQHPAAARREGHHRAQHRDLGVHLLPPHVPAHEGDRLRGGHGQHRRHRRSRRLARVPRSAVGRLGRRRFRLPGRPAGCGQRHRHGWRQAGHGDVHTGPALQLQPSAREARRPGGDRSRQRLHGDHQRPGSDPQPRADRQHHAPRREYRHPPALPLRRREAPHLRPRPRSPRPPGHGPAPDRAAADQGASRAGPDRQALRGAAGAGRLGQPRGPRHHRAPRLPQPRTAGAALRASRAGRAAGPVGHLRRGRGRPAVHLQDRPGRWPGHRGRGPDPGGKRPVTAALPRPPSRQ